MFPPLKGGSRGISFDQYGKVFTYFIKGIVFTSMFLYPLGICGIVLEIDGRSIPKYRPLFFDCILIV